MARVRWTRKAPREWDGDTGGWGRLRITAARPDQRRAMRFYLMDVPFMGDPTVMGDYDSLQSAKDGAEKFIERLK